MASVRRRWRWRQHHRPAWWRWQWRLVTNESRRGSSILVVKRKESARERSELVTNGKSRAVRWRRQVSDRDQCSRKQIRQQLDPTQNPSRTQSRIGRPYYGFFSFDRGGWPLIPNLLLISNVLIPDYMLDCNACQFMGSIIRCCDLSNELSIEVLIEHLGWLIAVWGNFWGGVVKRELGVECMHVRYGCPCAY